MTIELRPGDIVRRINGVSVYTLDYVATGTAVLDKDRLTLPASALTFAARPLDPDTIGPLIEAIIDAAQADHHTPADIDPLEAAVMALQTALGLPTHPPITIIATSATRDVVITRMEMPAGTVIQLHGFDDGGWDIYTIKPDRVTDVAADEHLTDVAADITFATWAELHQWRRSSEAGAPNGG